MQMFKISNGYYPYKYCTTYCKCTHITFFTFPFALQYTCTIFKVNKMGTASNAKVKNFHTNIAQFTANVPVHTLHLAVYSF